MKNKPDNNKGEINHEYTDEITCPHCGYEFGDSWEYGGDREDIGELDCGSCEKKFIATRNITVDYSTSKVSCEAQEGKHEQEFERLFVRKREFVSSNNWKDWPESEWKYYRIMKCTKCDETEYVELTKKEYEKMGKTN